MSVALSFSFSFLREESFSCLFLVYTPLRPRSRRATEPPRHQASRNLGDKTSPLSCLTRRPRLGRQRNLLSVSSTVSLPLCPPLYP